MISFMNLLKTYNKVILLLLMMVLGALLPEFQVLSFLVQYLLMTMLFFAFLDIEITTASFQKGVVWILLANLAIGFASYLALSFFDTTLALAAFMTAIAPTAISSPVIIRLIEGRVEYLVAAVLLTNISMSLVVPVALPALVGKVAQVSIWEVLQLVLLAMFVPLILARLARALPQDAQALLRKGKPLSFPLWLFNLFIISAKAADFLQHQDTASPGRLAAIALVSLVICVINFTLGAWLGGPTYWQEASQALGQKNTSFTIWIALTFINPLVAMGPTFYVLYHNLYNSWQIYRFEKGRRGASKHVDM